MRPITLLLTKLRRRTQDGQIQECSKGGLSQGVRSRGAMGNEIPQELVQDGNLMSK